MREAPFSPAFAYVASRPLTIDGVDYLPGDPIPEGVLKMRRLRQLYEQRKISPHAPAFLSNGAAIARKLREQAEAEAGEGVAEDASEALDALDASSGVDGAETPQPAPKARQSRKKG